MITFRQAALKGLRATGIDIRRPPTALLKQPERRLVIDLEHLLARRLLEGSDLYVVVIGAFDGHTRDRLHEWIVRYDWSGILIEPQPRAFAELQRTYAGRPKLELRNVAVSERRETRTLYSVRDGVPGLPAWAPQTASFDRAQVDRHRLRGPGGEDVYEATQVQCIPLSELLAGVARIDLLQVDVEGYDGEIIRMFDFDRYRPSIVRFESIHLRSREHNAAVRRLVDYEYQVAVSGSDTIAWYG